MKIRKVLGTGFVLIVNFLWAESVPDSTKVKYHLPPVVVTATKIPVVVDYVAGSVSVVDSIALAYQATPAVFSALQARIPSYHTTEWGVMGFGVAGASAGKISMRGVGGGANACVLILRNGRPDFMGLMGCTIADEFSTDGVERIEIIRGPGSFLYGTNAIGGVINIIPKRIKTEGFSTKFSAGYGEFDSRTISVAHGGKVHQWDYFVTLNYRRTDGHRPNSDYKGTHGTFHLGYQFNSSTTLEANANFADVYILDPGPVSSPRINNWYDVLRGGGDIHFTHQHGLGELNLKLHANFGKHKFFDGWNSIDRTTGVMLYHHFKPWSGNTTTLGVDWKTYGGDAKDRSTDYKPRYITEYAPYVHIQQVLFQKWIVSSGFRMEHHELYGNEFLPKVGLVYHVFEHTALRASVSKGFRSPSIRELYFWMPANEKLTPDRLWDYELGFSQRIANTFTLEADVFKMQGSNLIQLVSPPPKWTNSGSYTHTGYELVWSWQPFSQWELGGTWSKMDLSQFAWNAPGKKLTLYANTHWGPFHLSGDLLMVKDWRGTESQGSRTILHDMPDYTVVNLLGSIRIFRGLEWMLYIRNLFNEEYQAMYGYPMPKRNWGMEMRYTL